MSDSTTGDGKSVDKPIEVDDRGLQKDTPKFRFVQQIMSNLHKRIQNKIKNKNDNSSSTNKSSSTSSSSEPAGKEQLENMIMLAEYEIYQAPYRGIEFLRKVEEKPNCKEKHNDDDDDGDEETKGDDASESPICVVEGANIITPWDACQFGVLRSTQSVDRISQFLNHQIPNLVQQSDGSVLLDPKDPEILVRSLTEACCPSLVAWTKQNIEEEKKKDTQQRNYKKKRGRKRSRSVSSNDGTTESTTASSSAAHGGSLGLRPSNPQYRCRCDYNPFCLASLGGVVNDVLKERCQKDVSISFPDEANDATSAENSNSPNDPPSNRSNGKKTKVRYSEPSILEWYPRFSNGNSFASGRTKKDENDVVIINEDDDKSQKRERGDSKSKTNTIDDVADRVFDFLDKDPHDKNGTSSTSESSPSTDLTCIRLGDKRAIPKSGNPADVYSQEIDEQFLGETTYSQGTREELGRLRKLHEMEDSPIRSYLCDALQRSENTKTTVDDCMSKTIRWHKSLLFVPPSRKDRKTAPDHIRIALPPGIQNLGATCYLNTQLQCLAQNPVFLDGIFSWRPVNNGHKMNEVMSNLQQLLAQMLVGGDRKLSTLDVSNALGLDHYEQQDPNEFARLLFDRMEESFQQCSASNSSTRNSKSEADLSDLLRRIFHGTTTYETICMKCGTTSVRSEGFMDLNLPIVARSSQEKDGEDDKDVTNGKSNKKQKKETSEVDVDLVVCADTDVQFCLDQYTTPEILEGDNMYFCDKCKCKQNAKRVPKLTELPPVLNVQLSRYVFDRQKFVKKKLMDKVLLPTKLLVYEDGDSKRNGRPSKKTYILCAVMRHKGTSAYSGHYIAEAMDWTTGQWYEFNDESVEVLVSGPSCSYCPSFMSDETSVNSDKRSGVDSDNWNGSQEAYEADISGSQDAYNMYYVEQGYLAENAVNALERRQNIVRTSNNDPQDSVLLNVVKERERKHSLLREMCIHDWGASDRLTRRKMGIRKFMIVDSTSLLQNDKGSSRFDESYYWVDGDVLRKFLTCQSDLDDQLKSTDPIVCHPSILCPHGRLSPGTASRGKILRKPLYDAFISLLTGERKAMRETEPDGDDDFVVGSIIQPSVNLECQTCSESHKEELTQKVEFIQNVKKLYQAVFDERTDMEGEEEIFVVARSSITQFKKVAAAMIKSVARIDEGGVLEDNSGTSPNVFALHGIDEIDISCFRGSPPTSQGIESKDSAKSSGSDEMDEFLNRKITCPHNNCIDARKNVVRYLSPNTWKLIKQVFPNAIEHRFINQTNLSSPDAVCTLCDREKDSLKDLKSSVLTWVKATKDNEALKKLLDGNRTVKREVAVHNFTCAQNGCRLVHCDDISNFRVAVNGLQKLLKKCATDTPTELKRKVEDLAFPAYHSVVLEFERESIGLILQSLRSLICRAHKRVIKSALYQVEKDGDAEQPMRELSNCIAVLSDEEYNAYIVSLLDLLSVLNGERKVMERIDDEREECFPDIHDDLKTTLDFFHPAIRMKTKDAESSSEEVLLLSLDGSEKQFSLQPAGLCSCDTCAKEFVPLIQMQKPDQEDNIENVSVDSTDGNATTTSSKNRAGMGTTNDPIVIDFDSDPEGEKKVRVFEYKANSELDEALSSLRTAAGLTPGNDTDALGGFVRRSTRKRKTRYPVGCIVGEKTVEVGNHHNVAALRLLLFQNCEIPISSRISVAVDSETLDLPVGREMDFSCNDKSLVEIVKELRGITEESGKPNSDESDEYFVLYRDESEDSKEIEASIMDSLLEAANLDQSNKKSSNSKDKQKRSSERGFRGTLLQSSSSSGATSNQGDSPSDVKKLDTKKKADEAGRESPSMAAVSDEENQVDDNRSTTANKAVSSDSSTDESTSERGNVKVDRLPSPPAAKRARKLDGTSVGITDEDDGDIVKAVFKRIKENGIVGNDIDEIVLNEAIRSAAVEKCFSNPEDIVTLAIQKYFDDDQSDDDHEENNNNNTNNNEKKPDADSLSSRLSARLANDTESRNKDACLSAVLWAIENNNSRANEDMLYDAAYARYLHDQDQG